MKLHLRIINELLTQIHADLSRAHPFAYERVGFLTCAAANLPGGDFLLLGQGWHPVEDHDYVDDASVGACIGPAAFRKILQLAYREPISIFHLHRHEHRGPPQFSVTDERSMREFVPGFFNACRSHPHGALVISHDSAAGAVWLAAGQRQLPIDRFEVIGNPLKHWSYP